jgi:hypothetical protein
MVLEDCGHMALDMKSEVQDSFCVCVCVLPGCPCVYSLSVSLNPVKGKVKCTLVQALRLCTGRTAHRGSRSIALLFHDHGTRRK